MGWARADVALETGSGGWQAVNGGDGQAVGQVGRHGRRREGAGGVWGGEESRGGLWRPGHEAQQPGAHSDSPREPRTDPGEGSRMM